uniref:Complement C5-like protein n=1 Tax=Sinonovacula constricta TaxID=98310 RepID=A0A6M2Z8D2_SINCO|nr:complement C5-like protein [Sinonovacula constricta]
MMCFGLFLLSVCAHFVGVHGYYYVVAPNIFRFDYDVKVLVGILRSSPLTIEVWMEKVAEVPNQRPSQISAKNITVTDEKSPQFINLHIRESDVIGPMTFRKPKTLLLKSCVRTHNCNDIKTQQVLLSYHTGHLIVQTDKPVYTPGELVKARVLAMGEDFQPLHNTTVNIEITSPSQVTYERKIIAEKPDNGFYGTELLLPDNTEKGIWFVRSYYSGQFSTESKALFAVEEYVVPTFYVQIAVDTDIILPTNVSDPIKVNVQGKYVYGKPVDGTATIQLTAVKNGETLNMFKIRGKQLNRQGVVDFEIERRELCEKFPKACDVQQFPDGYRLKIIAEVMEAASGNKESTMDDSVLFTKKKYKVSFEKTKTTFRRTVQYTLMAMVTYVTGKLPLENTPVKMEIFYNGTSCRNLTSTTLKNGMIAFTNFSLHSYTKEVVLKVFVDNEAESDDLVVYPYQGSYAIQVEHVKKHDGEFLYLVTNGLVEKDSNIVVIVVSRGQIIHAQVVDMRTQIEISFGNIKKKIRSKDSRILAFFISADSNIIIADATWNANMEVVKCEGKKLNITPAVVNISPGKSSTLTIAGEPNMYVGLSIIDSALFYVSNSQEIISKDKMLSVLDEHDTGCGVGSGETAEHVFKNTGLTFLTDVKTVSGDLNRQSTNCTNRGTRVKRSVDDKGSCKTEAICCSSGVEYANEYFNENIDKQDIDPFTVCLGKTSILAHEKKENGEYAWLTKCLLAFYESCSDHLDSLIEPELEGKSLNRRNRYDEIISFVEEKTKQTMSNRFVRENFVQSWMFKNYQLNSKGLTTLNLTYPEDITTWTIIGLGITEDKGFCIAEHVSVQSFKEFFVQVKLPYEAIRLEQMDVEVTVFYYGSDQVDVTVFLFHSTGYCSYAEFNNPAAISIRMPPQSAKTVRFPIIPIQQGSFDLEVRAILIGNEFAYDGVKRKLRIRNEGIEERKAIEVCIDPLQQTKDCQSSPEVKTSLSTGANVEGVQLSNVDLTLTSVHLPGTAVAKGRISINLMDEIIPVLIDNAGNLLREPSGCVSQNMQRLGPTVYALNYLRKTSQMNADLETRGPAIIKRGINWQMKYYNVNGYYGYPRYYRLNAAIARAYCQAASTDSDMKTFIKNTGKIDKTLQWLVNSQYEFSPSELPWLALAFLECSTISQVAASQVNNLESRLIENKQSFDAMGIARAAYYLAKMTSPKAVEFRNDMMGSLYTDATLDYIYYKNSYSGGNIVVTSYALLTTLLYDDIKTASKMVAWISGQRQSFGSYYSSSDTTIALEAIAEYTVKTFAYRAKTNLDITLSAIGWPSKSLTLTEQNAGASLLIKGELPVNAGNNILTIKASGTGSARLMIDLRYNRPINPDEGCQIDVSDISIQPVDDTVDLSILPSINRSCDLCGFCQMNADETRIPKKYCVQFTVKSLNDDIGMSMIKFGLQSGVEADEDTVKLLKDRMPEHIDFTEMPKNGKSFITIYMHKITSTALKFQLIVIDTVTNKTDLFRQPASVEVFDYLNPDFRCTKYYKLDKDDNQLDLKTNCKNRICQCMEANCVTDTKKELRSIKMPALQLQKHTCDFALANYAVLVKVGDLVFDKQSNSPKLNASVVKVIHKGMEDLQINSTMTFKWRAECSHLNNLLNVTKGNRNFYIIGLDGVKVTDKSDHSFYEYDLMNTALVLRAANNPNSPFGKYIRTYEELMTNKGCRT